MNRKNRRDFLSLTAGLAATALIPWPSFAENPSELSDLRSDFLVSLGKAYLLQEPGDIEPAQLRRSVGVLQSGEIDSGRLQMQIREEFRHGDLVVVEGWHLSRSEARLYALLALE